MAEITQSRLRELLSYDPQTGEWRNRATGRAVGTIDHGYIRIKVDCQKHYAHRLAFLYMNGEWPPQSVDHKDTNGLNNKWSNLRLATKAQNGANRGAQNSNRSGTKGVSFCVATGKWRADIKPAGKTINLGRFDSIERASEAYAAAAEKHYGEFARS
jgi:hypothetical protein